jgi:hypothetical protein
MIELLIYNQFGSVPDLRLDHTHFCLSLARSLDGGYDRAIKPLRNQTGDRSGEESNQKESRPQGIYGIRCQNVEDAFEGQNAGIEVDQTTEAFGGFTEAEGP